MTPTSALFTDDDCVSAISRRPYPHFWTSASFLHINDHCPTRWQCSSQPKILLTFRYLTNINTEESHCFVTISPLFLKNTSSAAPDAVVTKSSLLFENWDQAAPINGFSCHFGPSNIANVMVQTDLTPNDHWTPTKAL